MPVFRSGIGNAPRWCEMESFEIIELAAGAAHAFDRVGEREKLIVARGSCRIAVAGATLDAEQGANLDLGPGEGRFEVVECIEDATLVRMCGRWGEETGGSGVFGLDKAENPENAGDPVDYPRETGLDNHYHDCDEYWIILAGRGVAVSEGKMYEVGPGDCVATGMGHHHDMARISEPIRGVYFETTMEGAKRPGHLWNHTHGAAEPRAERV